MIFDKFNPIVPLVVLCMLVSGCASPAKVENMVVSPSVPVTSDEENAAVPRNSIYLGEVKGGEKTNPLWTSEVSNDAFAGALRESLRSSNLLNENLDASTYRLTANLLGMSQPAFGFSLTVTTHVNYVLTNTGTGEVFLAETVKTPYTATPGDAFAAVKRLRLANEGSVKLNIRTFLDLLRAKAQKAKAESS